MVSTKPVDPTVKAESFECLVVKLISRRRRRLNIAAVYRPLTTSVYGTSVGQFCYDQAAFLDEFLALPGDPLITGDFNCPGMVSLGIDNQLADILKSWQLLQHIYCYTQRWQCVGLNNYR